LLRLYVAALLITVTLAPAVSTVPLAAATRFQIEVAAPGDFGEQAVVFGVNAVLGGVTAGATLALRGGSFLDGFSRGLVGGGIVYAGKRVAVEHFDGAGLLGRHIAAVGSSIVLNASDGRPTFDRLLLPLGPLPGRLIVTPGAATKVRPVADLVSVGSLVYGLASSAYELDVGASLSHGVAAFKGTRRENSLLYKPLSPELKAILLLQRPAARRLAFTVGNSIFLSAVGSQNDFIDPVFAHERVHVLQFDFALAAWSDRTDTWLLERAPGIDRYLKLNSVAAALALVNQTFFATTDQADLPWEAEAQVLAGAATPTIPR
jgi:hypothetical protein